MVECFEAAFSAGILSSLPSCRHVNFIGFCLASKIFFIMFSVVGREEKTFTESTYCHCSSVYFTSRVQKSQSQFIYLHFFLNFLLFCHADINSYLFFKYGIVHTDFKSFFLLLIIVDADRVISNSIFCYAFFHSSVYYYCRSGFGFSITLDK